MGRWTSSTPRVHEYNSGPCTWRHQCAVLYPNGERRFIHIESTSLRAGEPASMRITRAVHDAPTQREEVAVDVPEPLAPPNPKLPFYEKP